MEIDPKMSAALGDFKTQLEKISGTEIQASADQLAFFFFLWDRRSMKKTARSRRGLSYYQGSSARLRALFWMQAAALRPGPTENASSA